jgi:hypothetical protein
MSFQEGRVIWFLAITHKALSEKVGIWKQKLRERVSQQWSRWRKRRQEAVCEVVRIEETGQEAVCDIVRVKKAGSKKQCVN